MPKKPATTGDIAEAIIEKIQEQAKILIARNWPDISKIMEKDGGEIKLALTATITDRKATPGEQADKDNRIKLAISFSEKHSDSTEAALPDPNQPDLPGQSGAAE